MSNSAEQLKMDWWATGDTPVRSDSRVVYLVDGHITMLRMCLQYLKARQYIYIANWGVSAGIELVRGADHRAGPDGSPEQEALLAQLRAEGLDEAAIKFWCTHDLTLKEVLGYAVSKGVEVKALLWASPELFSHYSPKTAQEQLTQVGVNCILDDSAFGVLHHPVESLHQKIGIVDGHYAFVGGIDPLIELSGDFDRWDTHLHFFKSPLRPAKAEESPHPWHDVHALIEGPAASDVEANFRQRWNDVVDRHGRDKSLLVPEHALPAALESNTVVQVTRTIPQHTYRFDPKTGIQTTAQIYANAFRNARHFIYLENQYLWLRAFSGIDISILGNDSPDMEYNLVKIGEALRQGASFAMILPDHPNVGRAFTDAGILRLRAEAPQALEEGRLQFFCLGTSGLKDANQQYRAIYVHAKVAVIDDLWATAGSSNLNNRGMRDDTEMNVSTLDADLARSLRMLLMAEHLGIINDDEVFLLERNISHMTQTLAEKQQSAQTWQRVQEVIADPQAALRLMSKLAWDNLGRYKEKQPLVGHLLPYLTAQEAAYQGLKFHEEHGWIEEV